MLKLINLKEKNHYCYDNPDEKLKKQINNNKKHSNIYILFI